MWKIYTCVRVSFVKRAVTLSDNFNYVFVGLRRVGKSYLMYQQIHHLIEIGISPEEILFFNFEDERIAGMGGFMLDASIGKYIRLRNGKSISLNLSLTNILNNTDLRTGGFEQNRDDNYKDGDARVYKFSKNSKYFYAFPFNAFLNIGYRF